jgi:hypothetical protein
VTDRLVHAPCTAASTGDALRHAATLAGHGSVVDDLLSSTFVPEDVPDDIDLFSWAADYGAYNVIQDLLHDATDDTVRAGLEIARRWVGVDPVAELRRRLGDGAAEADRETVPVENWFCRAERIRVTAADGHWAEIQTTHLGIVTALEERLGVVHSRAELLARALANPDTDAADWTQAWRSVLSLADAEATHRWAADLLADPDREVRRFAAEVIAEQSSWEPPFPAEARAAVHGRLAVEADPEVLRLLIKTLDVSHAGGDLPDVLPFAGHADPAVRRQVAEALDHGLADSAAAPRTVQLLAELGADVAGEVRRTAARTLRINAPDHPATRRLLAAGREDPDPAVRLEALAGLAGAGDEPAYRELQRLADEAGHGSDAYWVAYDVTRNRSGASTRSTTC